MNTKLYVGNLSFDANEQDLKDLFEPHGEVTEVFMPTDRESGRPRGFAFVTMGSADAMNAAISALNGEEYQGRALVINEARPQGSAGDGGGYRSNGGGGGGGYRGGNNGGGGGYRGGNNGGGGGYGGRRDDNGYGGRNRR